MEQEKKFHLGIVENTTEDQWYPRETTYMTKEEYQKVVEFLVTLFPKIISSEEPYD